MMEHHLKYLLLFGELLKKIYLNLPPSKNYIVKKKSQIKSFFKNCIEPKRHFTKKKLV